MYKIGCSTWYLREAKRLTNILLEEEKTETIKLNYEEIA